MISPPDSSKTSAGSRVMRSLTSLAITKVFFGVAAWAPQASRIDAQARTRGRPPARSPGGSAVRNRGCSVQRCGRAGSDGFVPCEGRPSARSPGGSAVRNRGCSVQGRGGAGSDGFVPSRRRGGRPDQRRGEALQGMNHGGSSSRCGSRPATGPRSSRRDPRGDRAGSRPRRRIELPGWRFGLFLVRACAGALGRGWSYRSGGSVERCIGASKQYPIGEGCAAEGCSCRGQLHPIVA